LTNNGYRAIIHGKFREPPGQIRQSLPEGAFLPFVDRAFFTAERILQKMMTIVFETAFAYDLPLNGGSFVGSEPARFGSLEYVFSRLL